MKAVLSEQENTSLLKAKKEENNATGGFSPLER